MTDKKPSWDERFARGEELHGGAPSPPLPQSIEGVTPGRALDLACGAGRHAIFLAERGWRVHAIDSSRVGIQRMLDEAHRRGVADRIEAELADLEAPGFTLSRDYELICDFYFLHRPLFDQIRAHCGLFAAAIHIGKGRFTLAPGELQTLVKSWGWTILHEHEGSPAETGHHHDTLELIARR